MKKKNSKEAADFPGRFDALTWRPGDLMKNLETPGKTGRVDRYVKLNYNIYMQCGICVFFKTIPC